MKVFLDLLNVNIRSILGACVYEYIRPTYFWSIFNSHVTKTQFVFPLGLYLGPWKVLCFQVVVFAGTFTCLGFAIWGLTQLETRFESSWFLPQDSYIGLWESASAKYYSNAGERVTIYVSNVNYSSDISKIGRFVTELEQEKSIVDSLNTFYTPFFQFALDNFDVNIQEDTSKETFFFFSKGKMTNIWYGFLINIWPFLRFEWRRSFWNALVLSTKSKWSSIPDKFWFWEKFHLRKSHRRYQIDNFGICTSTFQFNIATFRRNVESLRHDFRPRFFKFRLSNDSRICQLGNRIDYPKWTLQKCGIINGLCICHHVDFAW